MIAHDLGDYIDATIDTAKLAAKYLAIVETVDAAGFQNLRTQAGTGADTGKKLEHLENAIIEYLRPGEKINFAKNDSIAQSFDPFTKFVLHMLSVATGVPFSILTGNYGEYNYTTLRGERLDTRRIFLPQQNRQVRQFSSPVIRDVIDWSVMAGRIILPGYWKNQRAFWRGVFITPGGEPIDPLRESKANRDDMAAGLQSPQEIVARRGRDLEDVYDELAEAQEMARERGLIFDINTDTAMANNPAAVGASETGDEEGTPEQPRTDKTAPAPGAQTIVSIKEQTDAYGVAVRAGALTPQIEDEEFFRKQSGLPTLSNKVKEAWVQDGGTRRPITLKSGEAFDAEQDQIAGTSTEETSEE